MRFFLILIATMILCHPVMAQNILPQESSQSSEAGAEGGQDSVQTGELSDLIQTLENDESRKEFVDQLKTLVEVNGEVEKPEDNALENVIAITETLGIEGQTQSFIDGYTNFLSNNNLNSSFIGKLSLSAFALIGFFVFLSLVKRFAASGLKKLLALKQKYALTHSRFTTYVRILRYGANIIVTLLFFYSLSLIWSVTDLGVWESSHAVALLGNTVNILTIVLIAAVFWEGINGFAEYNLRKRGVRNSARTQTLMPIVRKILFMVFMAIFTLMLLSELGINILPLMAGAGAVGIAVGFGAQTIVKDFLSGFTIILEDLIQVGDVVTLAGRSGLVEQITIRKIQLRGLDGTVYTVPFNEIDIIENMTKGHSYYLMDIGIAYREDPDEVIGYLKDIGEEMRNEDAYKALILDDIEILGVDNFADSAVIIKARIKTKPKDQWTVGREFNRRMKHVFDKNNVEMPFPHQTIYFGEDKQGKAPPAPIVVEDKSAKKTPDEMKKDIKGEDNQEAA